MIIKCVIACSNASGEPDLYFVKVRCKESQYEEGDHYRKAENQAIEDGYEEPFVSFDENDSAGRALCKLCEWSSIPTYRCPQQKVEESQLTEVMQ